jgi:cellulose biosynthesis protein BcsQ
MSIKYLAVDSNIELANREAEAWAKNGIGMERVDNMSEAIQKLMCYDDYIYIGINSDAVDCMPLLSMVDSRTNLSKGIINLIKEAYGEEIRIFNEPIPHSVRAAEASATGKSIFTHDPNGRVAAAYDALAKGVLEIA